MTPVRARFGLCLMAALLGGAVSVDSHAQPPSSSPESAEWMLQEAVRLQSEGELEAASRDFTLLVEHFPQSPQAGRALLRLAGIHRQMGRDGEAEEAARRVSLEHQGTPWGAGGLFVLGELEAEGAASLADLDDARASFRNVWVFYPGDALPQLEWRGAARVRYGEISLIQGAGIEAAAAFTEAIEGEPATDWTARAALGLATVLTDRDDWRSAAETLQEARQRLPPEAGRELLHRLTLIHRLEIRPRAGEARWRSSRSFGASRLKMERPARIAASPDGVLAVVDSDGATLVVVADEGKPRRREIRAPVGHPSWGALGDVHLPLQDGAVLADHDRKMTLYEPAKPGQGLKEVTAIERGIVGWWVLSAQRLMRFTADGAFRDTISQPPDDRPADLARDLRGRIYVLDPKSREVLRVEADGASRRTVVKGAWSRPVAVDVDALGNLYVLDQKSRRVEIFGPRGGKLDAVGPMLPGGVELKAPRDIAVDGEGRLFIADVKLGQIVVLE